MKRALLQQRALVQRYLAQQQQQHSA